VSRDCVHTVENEANEAVAFAFYAPHDFAPVNADRTVDVHAEWRSARRSMGCFGSSDEKLRRHTADAGARRTVRTTLNQYDGRAGCLGCAVRWEPGTAGADYRYIDLNCFHDFL